MSARKGGLGKGLDALFVDNATDNEKEIFQLKIGEIQPNREQPRKLFDDDALAELADSIAQHGILQPLLVRPDTNGGYQLVAGERRWRAARMAGLTEVPVVVREMTDAQMMELALIENLQREDLNPIEEAQGFFELMETYGLTQEEVSKRVGRSRPAVANALRLLGLPTSVIKLVQDSKITAGHARSLLAFTNQDELLKAAGLAAAGNATVRDLEKMAKRAAAQPQLGFKQKKTRVPFYDEVEIALTEQMGRKVRVFEGKGKGILEIEFYSQEDLAQLAKQFE